MEKKLKELIRSEILKAGGHVQNHEDKNAVGIPDISYGINDINGWIEAKYIKKWPISGIVKCDHLTPQQKNWLSARGMTGGHCYLILQVDNEYMIFGHSDVFMIGILTQKEMIKRSLFYQKHFKYDTTLNINIILNIPPI